MTKTERLPPDLIPEEPMPTTKSAKPRKPRKPAKKVDTRTSALPPLEPEMMNDILLAVHEKAIEVDVAREQLDRLVNESDALVREAVDDGERYRDIAASADRTVPWVQMSLRRYAGVPTHPAAPIPVGRVRKTSPVRKAS
jgi:hypothetical protein